MSEEDFGQGVFRLCPELASPSFGKNQVRKSVWALGDPVLNPFTSWKAAGRLRVSHRLSRSHLTHRAVVCEDKMGERGR